MVTFAGGFRKILYRAWAEGNLEDHKLSGRWILATPKGQVAVRVEKMEYMGRKTVLAIEAESLETSEFRF